jgi:hypothetical protein
VSVWGFACTGHQRIPVTVQYAQFIDNLADLQDTMNKVRAMVHPDGGTCPGKTIEAVVRQVEDTDPAKYPAKMAVLLTDGVNYDGKAPYRASSGLHDYDVATFAIGIAVPQGEEKWGLKPNEIKRQHKLLSQFANGVTSNVFSFDDTGFSALITTISDSIAKNTLASLFTHPPIPRYTWCGWRRVQACSQNNYRFGNCKWVGTTANWGCTKK